MKETSRLFKDAARNFRVVGFMTLILFFWQISATIMFQEVPVSNLWYGNVGGFISVGLYFLEILCMMSLASPFYKLAEKTKNEGLTAFGGVLIFSQVLAMIRLIAGFLIGSMLEARSLFVVLSFVIDFFVLVAWGVLYHSCCRITPEKPTGIQTLIAMQLLNIMLMAANEAIFNLSLPILVERGVFIVIGAFAVFVFIVKLAGFFGSGHQFHSWGQKSSSSNASIPKDTREEVDWHLQVDGGGHHTLRIDPLETSAKARYTCPKCGSPQLDDPEINFCTRCGENKQEVPVLASLASYCTGCGRQLPEDPEILFCTGCGRKRTASPLPEGRREEPATNKKQEILTTLREVIVAPGIIPVAKISEALGINEENTWRFLLNHSGEPSFKIHDKHISIEQDNVEPIINYLITEKENLEKGNSQDIPKDDKLKRLRHLIQRTDSLPINRLATFLDMDEDDTWDQLPDWAVELGFTIRGNSIVIRPS